MFTLYKQFNQLIAYLLLQVFHALSRWFHEGSQWLPVLSLPRHETSCPTKVSI